MPERNTGKRWKWPKRNCECGKCKRCYNRAINVARYRAKFAKGQPEYGKLREYVTTSRLPKPKLPKYDWDRT